MSNRFDLPPIPPARPRAMRPTTEVTEEQKALYLAHLASCGLVGLSAEAAGISRRSVVNIRDRDEAFREAEEDAKADFHERLEFEAIRRGFEGVDEAVYYQGSVCGSRTNFDSSLAAMVLKARLPKYRDKVSVDANVRAGVMLAPASMTGGDWAKAFGGESDAEARTDGEQ